MQRGNHERVRARIALSPRRLEDLTFAEYLDIIVSVGVECPGGFINGYEWQEAMVKAFYGEDETSGMSDIEQAKSELEELRKRRETLQRAEKPIS